MFMPNVKLTKNKQKARQNRKIKFMALKLKWLFWFKSFWNHLSDAYGTLLSFKCDVYNLIKIRLEIKRDSRLHIWKLHFNEKVSFSRLILCWRISLFLYLCLFNRESSSRSNFQKRVMSSFIGWIQMKRWGIRWKRESFYSVILLFFPCLPPLLDKF